MSKEIRQGDKVLVEIWAQTLNGVEYFTNEYAYVKVRNKNKRKIMYNKTLRPLLTRGGRGNPRILLPICARPKSEWKFNHHPKLFPNDGQADTRYHIGLEWCGYEKTMYVVRFIGVWVWCAETYNEALEILFRHNKDRRLVHDTNVSTL